LFMRGFRCTERDIKHAVPRLPMIVEISKEGKREDIHKEGAFHERGGSEPPGRKIKIAQEGKYTAPPAAIRKRS